VLSEAVIAQFRQPFCKLLHNQEGLRYHRAAYRADASFRCHEWGKRFRLMQMMQLLASSGVTMAAGAMISLSFALSPPLTLLPPRSAPIDINRNVVSQKHQTIETVGAATADAFERRWQAASDAPLLLVPMLTPSRDPLEGLIGGLPMQPFLEDTSQVMQAAALDRAVASQVDPQPVKVALQDTPAQRADVCARQGMRRVGYTQNRHRYWRCVARR
jgi:hypothetical protein